MIGANEKKTDKKFLKRVSRHQGYSTKCPTKKLEWAEIKSSLLMKNLTHNPDIHNRLTIFLRGIITRFLNMVEKNLENEIQIYMAELKHAKQKDKVRSYPVAQSTAWIDNPEGLWSNPYALINFIKWMWYKLKYGDYYNINLCQKNPVFVFTAMDIFQQHILIFHDMARGNRLDVKENNKKNDQIGITNFITPLLKREVYGKSGHKIDPWFHPGNDQCFVPHHGKYGTYMKNFEEEDSFYASVQCGISGSVQYMLFMFLLSIKDYNTDPLNNITDIIMTCCLYLVGDGGHNIREVISGLTISVIILNSFIQDVKLGLQLTFKNSLSIQQNLTNVKNQTQIEYKGNVLPLLMKSTLDTINQVDCKIKVNIADVHHQVFTTMIQYCSQWETLITTFYRYTSDFNVVGVYTNDLNAHDTNILKNPTQSYNNLKVNMYDALFFRGNNYEMQDLIHSEQSYNAIQVFLALDNGRYKLNPNESFKLKPNSIMNDVIGSIPNTGDDILNNVNKQLAYMIDKCSHKADTVPFAFSHLRNNLEGGERSHRKRSHRKSRKRRSQRKSRKRSQRKSRKRSQRKSRKRRSQIKSRKRRSRKNCSHGITLDGNCKKKSGPKKRSQRKRSQRKRSQRISNGIN
jgi:hypothetical protein